MSQRRISKKQSQRIIKKHENLHSALEMHPNAAEGLVITRFSNHAKIEDDSKHIIHCSISPSISSLVAGDKVIWLPEKLQKQGLIVSRCPRKTVLGRPSKQGKIKAVAANISQMLIVLAPRPEVSWSLLDSYLVIAERTGLDATIVLNKTDLACEQITDRLEIQYAPLGYPLLFTSKTKRPILDKLEHHLTNQVSVFVGQSGVGKSSLISTLLPNEIAIEVSHIADKTSLGRHTTSKSTYYHLPKGGAIIDSPGVREFGLWHMPAAEIAKGFKEFQPFLSQCKFRDCDHDKTPGCALIQAVKEEKIFADRLKNYVKICEKFST